MTLRTGKCLCGACSFTAEPFGTSQACHCDMCRTWGGGPFMSVPSKNTSFEGPITRFESSEHAVRGFCSACGTHMYFQPAGAPVYGIPMGVFDDQSDLPFKAEIFVDEKPDFYAFEGERKQMTGAEFVEKFR